MFEEKGKQVALVITFIISFVIGGKIKIIDEPFSLVGSNQHHEQYNPQEIKLFAKVDPRPVSGPDHFVKLAGKCFYLTKGSFKYEFCPFKNLTQREQSYRWNAFHGVLGVWKEWEIANNTFISMKMDNGKKCVADLLREAKVFLICGERDELADVTEPVTCKYEVRFLTPAACPTDTFLVYPSLSESSRRKWDDLESKLHNEEITIQGYNKKLKDIFADENLLAYPGSEFLSRKLDMDHRSEETGSQISVGGRFSNLNQCSKEYEDLLQEVKRLRVLVNASTNYLDRHTNQREKVAAKVISEIMKRNENKEKS